MIFVGAPHCGESVMIELEAVRRTLACRWAQTRVLFTLATKIRAPTKATLCAWKAANSGSQSTSKRKVYVEV